VMDWVKLLTYMDVPTLRAVARDLGMSSATRLDEKAALVRAIVKWQEGRRAMQPTTRHESVFPIIEELTDRVMNWYGFTNASDYRMRPWAMLVAIEIYGRWGHALDLLTATDIETADAAMGGKMKAMWSAVQGRV
jgi:hypothetical protein